MACFHPESILYIFLLLTICITLAFFSRSIPYTIPTTKDEVVILYTNIDYLSQLILRLDHMLEVIYFGFLAALLFLGFCYGRMRRRATGLEAKVEEWIKATKAMSAVGVGCEVGFEHPAYEKVSNELANGTDLDRTVRDLVLREIDRHVDVRRIETLEKEIEQLRGICGWKGEEEKMAAPTYRQDHKDATVCQ